MNHSGDNGCALFMCRTPLQAKICYAIIHKKSINNFDVVYFSQNDSVSDRFYFNLIKEKSRNSLYLYVKKKKVDIFNHLVSIFKFSRIWKHSDYTSLYIASIDSFLFRYIVKKSIGARLFGFDDGAANFSKFGHYHNFSLYKKANIYSKILRLPTVKSVRKNIFRHYSIYEGFENIVPCENVRWLDVFDFGSGSESMDTVTFFIGQPFFEYLTTDEVKKLREWIGRQKIDFYIKHPREVVPIISSVKILRSNGLLAEDLISKTLEGRSPMVIAGYSSVLFNLPRENVQKIYLSIKKDVDEKDRVSLIKKAGCLVVNI
jgi:hypothetical protein